MAPTGPQICLQNSGPGGHLGSSRPDLRLRCAQRRLRVLRPPDGGRERRTGLREACFGLGLCRGLGFSFGRWWVGGLWAGGGVCPPPPSPPPPPPCDRDACTSKGRI